MLFYSCFHTTIAEMNSCERRLAPQEALDILNITVWPFKMSQPLDLESEFLLLLPST